MAKVSKRSFPKPKQFIRTSTMHETVRKKDKNSDPAPSKLSKIFPKKKNAEASEAQKRSYFFSFVAAIIVLLIIILAVVLKMYFSANKKLSGLQTDTNPPITPSEKEIKDLTTKLDRHFVLPDEEPKVILLSNINTLKNEQRFFEKANDGDIIFIYSQKVILYDPVRDKIIDVAQIRFDVSPSPSEEEDSPTPSLSPSPTKKPANTPTAKPTIKPTIKPTKIP